MQGEMYYMADKNGHVAVLVDEEYGYRRHLWFTGMTFQELETFWRAIPDMYDHYMDPTKTLPGKWQTAVTQDDHDAWMEYKERGQMYVAHIHINDDSYLAAPDGRNIVHVGHQTIK